LLVAYGANGEGRRRRRHHGRAANSGETLIHQLRPATPPGQLPAVGNDEWLLYQGELAGGRPMAFAHRDRPRRSGKSGIRIRGHAGLGRKACRGRRGDRPIRNAARRTYSGRAAEHGETAALSRPSKGARWWPHPAGPCYHAPRPMKSHTNIHLNTAKKNEEYLTLPRS